MKQVIKYLRIVLIVTASMTIVSLVMVFQGPSMETLIILAVMLTGSSVSVYLLLKLHQEVETCDAEVECLANAVIRYEEEKKTLCKIIQGNLRELVYYKQKCKEVRIKPGFYQSAN